MRRARGMTLMEVLIATTILASLTVIVAMLWAQTKQWTDETRSHDSSLRLQRSLDLLDRQWAARLTTVELADGSSGAVVVDDARLDFITTESALFPDWPLVRASYVVRPAEDDGGPWSLVYEEVRLGTTFNAGTEVVLEDYSEALDLSDLRRAELLEFESRPGWSAVLSDAQIADWEAARGLQPEENADESGSRWIGLTEPNESQSRRWAGLERADNPEAVRLDGATREGGFAWALVGQPLR